MLDTIIYIKFKYRPLVLLTIRYLYIIANYDIISYFNIICNYLTLEFKPLCDFIKFLPKTKLPM